jgi:uncharacterized protein YceK
MKKIQIASILLSLCVVFLSGCVAIGNHDGHHGSTTLGQQLIDLQKARDAGALSEAEYQTQRAKLLGHK